MPTKTQAKNAAAAALVTLNNEIDNILPNGTNIQDGKLDFNPTRGYIKQLAPDKATADSWIATMIANLDAAARNHGPARYEGSYNESNILESVITIQAPPFLHQIHF